MSTCARHFRRYLVVVAVLLSLSAVFASAQTFSPIPPLFFTKPFGGANPLPQVLTITSTDGSSIRFTPVASTNNGGSWLSVSPSGTGCCFTPEAITATVNADNSLAAGTYTGQIVVTNYPTGDKTLTVPVTLTVAPTNSPFFDNTAGALSFSMQTNATGMPSQSIQIRNGGTGSLPWTGTASTADGGHWLVASPLNGTAPSTVTVSINLQNLPGQGATQGTFIGMLTFNATGSKTTVPIAVTVGDNVFRQINPLAFSMTFGGTNPLPQIVTVAGTGTSIRFTPTVATAKGGAWLTISPSGVGCCFTPESFTVSVNASTLAAGVYTAQITFTQYPSSTPSITVPVTLNVAATNTKYIDNMAGQLSFSMKTSAGSVPAQTVQIRNGGTGTFTWTAAASTADNGNWLHISPATGGTPATISVSIDPLNLPNAGQIAGTFTGQITFQTTGSSVTIPVSVMVGDNVFRQINPIAFSMPFGGANPLPQILTVAGTGTSIRFTPTVATGKGGSWLSISPSGTGCCFTPEAFTVSVNASTLAAGTYTGEITFTQYPNGNLSITVPVSLTVAATNSKFFDGVPGQLSFSLQTNQTSVPAQSFQIRNAGTGTFPWTAATSTADGNDWLTATPLSGNTPSIVTVSVDPSNLPGFGQIAGTFVGQVAFTSAGGGVTVPISVTVGDNVFRQINPLAFTMPFGGPNPLPQVITVAGTGTSIRFTPTAATGKGGNWLTVSPSGVGCCFTPEAFTVSVNASTLAAGTYVGEINIIQYPSGTPSLTVPVTLTVEASAANYIDNMPGQLSFSVQTGATAVTAQVIQIRNAGTGPLQWTSTTTTADGGNWLTITPTSGNTPKDVTVNVTASNLPNQAQIPGTFVGQIVFQTNTGNATIPVTVVVGDNVFRQINPLTFSMPFGGPNPLPQTVVVAGTGTSIRFTPTFNTAKGGSWLTVTPVGTGCCFTPEAFNVAVNATSLAAGTYTGEINFIQYPSGTLSLTVPVALTVAASGTAFFDNMPGQVSFSFAPSTQNPPAQTVQILNGGSGSLSWTRTASTADTAAWLSATPGSGTAPSTVTVRVATNKLPGQGLIAGTYIGRVAFQSKNGGTTVGVSVVVGDPVFDQLPAVTFTATQGTNPSPQALNIASTSGSLRFTPVANTGKGGNWLSISPSGIGCCFTPTTITATVTSASLAPGTYVGQIVFTLYPSNDEAMTVPVILTVNSPLDAFLPTNFLTDDSLWTFGGE
ncbi:MAG TPA: hypothetical protein VH437_13140 [Terriglobales bacterium]